jgi:hypothetical protein
MRLITLIEGDILIDDGIYYLVEFGEVDVHTGNVLDTRRGGLVVVDPDTINYTNQTIYDLEHA